MKEILLYWSSEEGAAERTGFVPDWGEPTCAAYGRFWNGRYDVRKQQANGDDFQSRLGKSASATMPYYPQIIRRIKSSLQFLSDVT